MINELRLTPAEAIKYAARCGVVRYEVANALTQAFKPEWVDRGLRVGFAMDRSDYRGGEEVAVIVFADHYILELYFSESIAWGDAENVHGQAAIPPAPDRFVVPPALVAWLGERALPKPKPRRPAPDEFDAVLDALT